DPSGTGGPGALVGPPAVALEDAGLVADTADLAERHAAPVPAESEGVHQHRALDEVGLRGGGEELRAEGQLEVGAADAERLGESVFEVRVLQVMGAVDRVFRTLRARVHVDLEGQALPLPFRADTHTPQLGGHRFGRGPVAVDAE